MSSTQPLLRPSPLRLPPRAPICLAIFSTALGGIAMFRGLQRAFLGPAHDVWRAVPDLLVRERVALFGIVAAVVLTGIFPTHLVEAESDAVSHILQSATVAAESHQ